MISSRWPAAPRPLRLARRLGGAALAAVVLVYAAGLVRARQHPEAPEEQAARLSEARVLQAMDQAGLRDEFQAQSPRWITYTDVFAEQAANYGALTGLNLKLVAWWGRLRFAQVDRRGGLKAGYLIVEPRPGDFGGARLSILRAPGVRGPERRFRDGDIVTLIAHLYYEDRPIETPTLVFHDALPGRFDRPPEGQSP